MERQLSGVWLGRRRYEAVFALQRSLAQAKRDGAAEDVVLFLEHEPVITLGSGGKTEHVLGDEVALRAVGVDVQKVGRGGDVTLHAPGQLVCYPILNLAPERQDVRRYVRDLTETMRRLVAEHGIASGTHPEHIGLWVDRRAPDRYAYGEGKELAKIGAIGVSISRWVTMHGFALNLTTDLSWFRLIVPCGIREHGVTSVLELTGRAIAVRAAAERALSHLADVIGGKSLGLRDLEHGAAPFEALGRASLG